MSAVFVGRAGCDGVGSYEAFAVSTSSSVAARLLVGLEGKTVSCPGGAVALRVFSLPLTKPEAVGTDGTLPQPSTSPICSSPQI